MVPVQIARTTHKENPHHEANLTAVREPGENRFRFRRDGRAAPSAERGAEHRTASQLANPLYLGIGEADEVQSIAMHQPFLDAVADLDHVDVTTYPGADHGFTWPGYPTYDEGAAEGSWAKTSAMLGAALG